MKPIALAAFLLAVSATLASAQPAQPHANRPSIVAAENFYGDIAAQLAGPAAQVASILTNPDQDPHLFEASPSVARGLSGARIVVMNGADYDPWMTKLLGAARAPDRTTIVVADLVGKKPGDNPHLWYDTAIVAAYAKAMTAALIDADPADRAAYETRLHSFTASLAPIDAKIAAMRARFASLPVTATEPVFGYMATALGLAMRNEQFQLAVMNDTEPRASDIAAFETDLRGHRVRLLLYNSQATNGAAKRLLRIANQSKIPVVGITETAPAGKSYQRWMTDQLDAVDAALSKPPA
jgi:zinc/manganese transport system substrate-binding protein